MLVVALVALAGAGAYAHNFLGLQHPLLARARVESPNASETDFPLPIPGSDLYRVCFRVRNSSPVTSADSRITAVGFDVPGNLNGYTLFSATAGGFQLIEQVEHVPELPGVALDFALITGTNFAGGRPHLGLARSSVLSTFCVDGPFDPSVAIEQLLGRGVVRFQSVGAGGELGDIAIWERSPFVQ
jgi:hypothetical protein